MTIHLHTPIAFKTDDQEKKTSSLSQCQSLLAIGNVKKKKKFMLQRFDQQFKSFKKPFHEKL
jgi:hypothetical protein